MAAFGGHKLKQRGESRLTAGAGRARWQASPVRGAEGAIKVFSPRAGSLNRGPWFTRSAGTSLAGHLKQGTGDGSEPLG